MVRDVDEIERRFIDEGLHGDMAWMAATATAIARLRRVGRTMSVGRLPRRIRSSLVAIQSLRLSHGSAERDRLRLTATNIRNSRQSMILRAVGGL